MNKIEQVRLNREDFVRWLGNALSGAVVMPRASSSGTNKPTDVTLIAPLDAEGTFPVVCIPQAQMHDLFAFLSTYTNIKPFSAFFRVLPLELISVLNCSDAVSKNRRGVAKCVAGAAMAEAWIASARDSDRPKNAFPLLLASLSSALGQAVLAGYTQQVRDWTVKEWIELRNQPNDPYRNQRTQGTSTAWRMMDAAVNSSKLSEDKDADLIIRFLSDAIGAGTVQPAMLRTVAPLASGIDFESLIVASRENRINHFNDLIARLKQNGDHGPKSEFVAGLMLAISGNGSFDLLRSAREFDGWLDGATTWFGICAALFDDGNILSYGNSVGRRMVRDIMACNSPFGSPRADINSSEYRFFSPGEAFQMTAHAPNSLDVELLPHVFSCVVATTPQESDGKKNEVEMLLRSLDEASYLIDRARRSALQITDFDRKPASYKSSRSGKPR